ncbi:MAG: hypothetical protein ACRECW_11985 [Phyllobacterium sp.]
MIRKIAISAVMLCASASLAFSASSVSTVKSGQQAVIESLVSWDSNCKSVAYPRVTLRRVSPGTIYYQNTNVVIPPTREAGRCAGKVVRGTNILYKSPKGYTGKAKVRMQIRPSHINRTFTLNKDIRVMP